MKFFKKLLPFVLSLLVVLSAFPVTAAAQTLGYHSFQSCQTILQIEFSDFYTPQYDYDPFDGGDPSEAPFNSSYGSYSKLEAVSLDIRLPVRYDAHKGDIATLSIEFAENYIISGEIYGSFSILNEDKIVSYTNDVDFSSASFNDNVVSVDCPIKNDGKFIGFSITIIPDSYSCPGNTPYKPKIIAYEFSAETETQNLKTKISNYFSELGGTLKDFFSNLWQWLQGIIDAIKEIPTKIGESLSSLGDSISGFFTNLINNISEWFSNLIDDLSSFFSNVGNWFTELANKIKGFFTNLSNNISGFFNNLWTNITSTVTDIRTAVSDWWQSVVDFFHSLFVPEEGYFNKYKSDWEEWARSHFGALYQAFEIVGNLTEMFSLDGSADNASIVIPEIRLPFLGKPVIMEQQTFSFNSIINPNNAMIYYGFQLFKLIITVIFYSLLLNYLYKTFNSVFGIKEGDE